MSERPYDDLLPVLCPRCGTDFSVGPQEVQALARLVSPTFGEVVRILARRPGEYVDATTLASAVWRADPHGGPEDANRCVHKLIRYNQPRMHIAGWAVEGRRGRQGGYRLARHAACTPIPLLHGASG